MAATISPASFVAKWQASQLGEHRNGNGAPQHFLDLCELLGQPKPADVDPAGEWYSFEKGALRSGSKGWADVWKRDHFAFEYKGPHANLDQAYIQLKQYADALANPPLLIVSDTKRIIIRTNFTNTVTETHVIELADLPNPRNLDLLRWAFTDPGRLRPQKTIAALTDEAATKFARLSQQLRSRGHDAEKIAHFVNRLAFCMFAEDVNLLPRGFFTERLHTLVNHPERAESSLRTLFSAMSKGGMYGDQPIEWFNGGLFEDDNVLPLTREDLALLHDASCMDWQDIDPSIFGTLFERGLDPAKRSQLGAHYTDAAKIAMIVEPVIREPLLREWTAVKAKIAAEWGRKTTRGAASTKSHAKILALRDGFIERLTNYRVLDPACGSGNFLYVALKELKRIEAQVYFECEQEFGMQRPILLATGPHNMLGIEINTYAAELARMSVWIGEIQWSLKNGWEINRKPILQTLHTIQNHDALLNEDGTEFEWPESDAIIGNPPFLGSKKLQPELGKEYIARLRKRYGRRLPDGADFVCFWFLKASEALSNNLAHHVGLISTTSIRGGQSQSVLKRIVAHQTIYRAWSDEPWTVDGAAVRVSLICFSTHPHPVQLNGATANQIHADLTAQTDAGGVDLTTVNMLRDNKGIAFQGVVPRSSLNRRDAAKYNLPPASFVIPGPVARAMLSTRGNPNGRPNSDVVRPFLVGDDITSGNLDRFVIDFGEMTEQNAALYEQPFRYIQPVKAHRAKMNQPQALERWWQHWNTRPAMRQALSNLSRFIITPETSKHRLFTWCHHASLPDHQLYAIARDDDVTFGILQSRFHELWALRLGSDLGATPRYTPSKKTFEAFPFPNGLEPNRKPVNYDNPYAEAIGVAARELNRLREAWLNSPELVNRLPEVVPGYPDRIVPKSEEAKVVLNGRTLTKLYNAKPMWLQHAHNALDAAVAAAYGLSPDLSDDEIIRELLLRNREAPSPT